MKQKLLLILVLILATGVSFAQTYTLKVTVPDTVTMCFATGSYNGWSLPSTIVQKMTKISDSPKVFTLDIEVSAADVATTEYKYYAGPDWKYEQTQAATFKLSELDADGDTVDTFKAICNPNWESDVTMNVLVPASVYQLFITGNFNGWDPSANPMTKVDSTVNGKEFSLVIHSYDTTTLAFKFIAGPGWAYQQTAGDFIYLTVGNNVVCDAFNAIYDPTKVGDITFNITVPEGTVEVWVVGSYNNWDITNAVQATKNLDGTFTAVVPQVQNMDYKIWCHNDWPYEEAHTDGSTVADRHASFETDPVVNLTVENWKQLWTSVNDISTSYYRYYTQDGTIVVEGVLSGVSVYDLTGRMVEKASLTGTFVSKNLKSGIYIVRIDNQAHKIFVQ
jgi:hypothetical protein